MKILVTQSGMKHSLGMIRSLARQGHEVYGLVHPGEKQPLAFYSRYCRRVFYVDQQNEETFLRELVGVLVAHQFDVLIPVGFPVTHYVAKHASDLTHYVRFLSPSYESELVATDKFEIQQLAQKVGVPSPRTLLVMNRDEIGAASEKLGFPIIMKGRRESGQSTVATAHTPDELSAQFQDLATRFSLDQEAYPVLQEFVPGWGCGFFAIYDKGECKRVFMHRRIREYPPTGGVSCCARSFHDARLSEYGRKLLDALAWNGVAMVEFRYDERIKDYKLIEINAKFWGSLELALASGADFPGDYVKISTGQVIPFTDQYDSITYQWLLSGDLLHGLRRPWTLPSIVFTALNPFTHKDFLRFDDPVVLFMKVFKLLKETVRLVFRLK
jgi:predicted ATP-grasp superfamily ATP-dependent carboligase